MDDQMVPSQKRSGRVYRSGHTVLTLSIPPSFLDQVNALCNRLGISRSELFRQSVETAHPELSEQRTAS